MTFEDFSDMLQKHQTNEFWFSFIKKPQSVEEELSTMTQKLKKVANTPPIRKHWTQVSEDGTVYDNRTKSFTLRAGAREFGYKNECLYCIVDGYDKEEKVSYIYIWHLA